MKGSLGIIACAFVLIAGCRSVPDGAAPSSSQSSQGADVRPQARAGVCSPSSTTTGAGCPKRVVPPGNGTSPDGCKSDADCKQGIEGRCIMNRHTLLWEPQPGERVPNMLAAPPPPPKGSICVYDACESDKDCGAGVKCNCGSGEGRNRNSCFVLDSCLADRDCKDEMLCMCGASGAPNACALGNCRTDADCGHGLACTPDANGSRFCFSPRDACKKPEDCKVDAASYGMPICVYNVEKHARECGVRYPPPPG